ncbi:Polyadenylate-binding protein, cytoplasmic and nuclear [Astathelohania contejeani]|uniref:Polyadenylate-binding protein, cytoplasmic and nuclear n=1 Tax=Astathelohania contejeani TaxID=164912 RepID=A0ABQ7I2M3_9MICR|nr:Polyadenylate-binding protein, cytoplasmic and nuclear [Thelohania contejeani]
MESTESTEHKSDATLYVGDLSPKTLESELFRLFSSAGTIASIKIVRQPDDTSYHYGSMCYAYINYTNAEDAARAIAALNFHELHGREMRVMYCNKKSIKEYKEGNIVVKNLPLDCDNKTLNDTFKIFGEIVTCKVATTTDGKSKGFGFIQFRNKINAKQAIKYANGTNMKNSKLKVEKYVPKGERESGEVPEVKFTNLYVKNFPSDVTEEDLVNLLSKYGKITSIFFPLREDGTTKGFAFFNFETHESALRAIEKLHGTYPFGQPEKCTVVCEPFYIQRAQTKAERMEELRKEMVKKTAEGINIKRNLYVTNIPASYGYDELFALFKEFGTIVSLAVHKDSKIQSGLNYAYICFSVAEEAALAMERGNEIYLDGNKLNVDFFKSKHEREQNRENLPPSYPYQQNVPYFYRKGGGYSGETPRPHRKSFDMKQMGSELYNLVLSVAPSFQSKWKAVGIESEEEFAHRVTKILLEKSVFEIRNMIGLGNVLTQNIGETLQEMSGKGNNEDSLDLE